MVVSAVNWLIDSSADVLGDPGSGGFDTVDLGVFGVEGDGGDADFYGANPDVVLMSDSPSGGIFDEVRVAIDDATDALPPDVTDIDAPPGGDLDPPDDGAGILDDHRGVLGGAGGDLGSVLGEGGPDDVYDVFDPPVYDEARPIVTQDDWGGDELPVITAPDVDDLDLDLGSVASPGMVDSPVDDAWVTDDLDVAIVGQAIDAGGGDVDYYGGDDFGMTNGGDPGIDFGTDDLAIVDLDGGMELPEIDVPEPTQFQQDIEAADSLESSLDDLFGDLG